MRILKLIRPNLESITQQLLNSLKVKISPSTVDFCLQEHPGYPTLLALSDCLSEWKVENQGYYIKRENYDSDDLLFPFIAHLKENGGRFILVRSILDGRVVYSDELKKKWEISESEFLDRWDGIAHHAEKTYKSGEDNYLYNYIHSKFSSLIIPGLVAVAILTLTYIILARNLSLNVILLLCLKLAGTTISILLLIQSIGAKNPFLKRLCGITGKNDCNDILQSGAAKITPWLSWSEVGFFYFLGTMGTIIIEPSALNIIVLLNILSLPYTVYSLSYQYRIKSWCILCCSVQVILWLEFFTNLSSHSIQFRINPFHLVTISIIFLAVILIWAFLKPFFIRSSQFSSIKTQLKKFKYNGDLFNKALTSQARYAVPENLMPVVLGNPDGKTVITMVGSPYCDPCGKAYKELKHWCEVNNDVKVKLIFKTGGKGNDKKILFTEHVTAMSLNCDKIHLESAIEDWYAQSVKKYENWKNQYPVEKDERIINVIEKQKNWCELLGIIYTPTILVNGYMLPEPYGVEDIKYFTELP